MNLQPRDKRAVLILGSAIAAYLAFYLATEYWPTGSPAEAASGSSIPQAEQRLVRLRQLAATVPAREKMVEDARQDLAAREAGLLQSETAAQEQALLLQIVQKLAGAQAPAIELRQTQLGAVEPLGKDYAQAAVTVSFVCRIEQLVNLLADISARPELISTRDLQVRQADAKQKTVNVSLTVSGAIPRALLTERKGPAGV
jgi:hypothetical protein